MQKGYLLHRGNAIYGLILLNHKQQAHFELALRGNAVQAVFVKAETFACVQLVILTLIVNDCFAFQCGQDGVAGGAVWGQAGARPSSPKIKRPLPIAPTYRVVQS